MSQKFNFQVQFNNFKKELLPFTFLTLSEDSMSRYSYFKEELGYGLDVPFHIFYVDEENDIVPIDSEEEYREFYKFAIQQLVEENNVKLIITLDEEMQLEEKPITQGLSSFKEQLKKEILAEIKKDSEDHARMPQILSSTSGNRPELNTVQHEVNSSPQPGSCNSPSGNFPKKLCLKDSVKLEKLELKRKKLLEKAMTLKELGRRSGAFVQDSTSVNQPYIMSGIATYHMENLKVTAGKIFVHTWTITNDGTYPWTHVTLQHHWSSLGLEPLEHVIQCPNLSPGYSDTVSVRFRAPKLPKQLQSYWFFHFQRDIQGPLEKFGHYVLFTGQSRLPKSADSKNPEGNCKKLKLEKKLQKEAKLQKERLEATRQAFGTYIFSGGQEDQGFDLSVINQAEKTAETPKTCAEVAETLSQGRLSAEAALASTQIAAEMTREAAIAKFRRLMEQKRTDAPNKSDENKLNTLEEAAMAALAKMELGERARPEAAHPSSTLNLVESGSDTDANNEESDPEFVMVDVPNEFPSDKEEQEGAVSSSTEKEINTGQAILKENAVPLSENSGSQESNGKSAENKESSPMPMFKGATQQPEDVGMHFSPPIPSSADIQPQQHFASQPTYQLNSPSRLFHAPFAPYWAPNAPSSGSDNIADSYYFNRLQSSLAMYNKYKQAQHNSTSTPYSYCKKSSGHHSTMMSDIPAQASVNASPNKHTKEATIDLNVLSHQVAANLNAPTVPVSKSISCFETVTSSVLTSAISSTRIATEQAVAKTEAPVTAGVVMQPASSSENKEPTVEILPQALVDGAINVAASAYSTAWNALNNLRPKEGTTGKTTVEFDPVFEYNMALLVEMGFRSIERNALLLKEHNNDLNQVIGIICATPPSDDFRGLNID